MNDYTNGGEITAVLGRIGVSAPGSFNRDIAQATGLRVYESWLEEENENLEVFGPIMLNYQRALSSTSVAFPKWSIGSNLGFTQFKDVLPDEQYLRKASYFILMGNVVRYWANKNCLKLYSRSVLRRFL